MTTIVCWDGKRNESCYDGLFNIEDCTRDCVISPNSDIQFLRHNNFGPANSNFFLVHKYILLTLGERLA